MLLRIFNDVLFQQELSFFYLDKVSPASLWASPVAGTLGLK